MIQYDSALLAYYSTLINKNGVAGYFGTRQTGDGRNLMNITDFLAKGDIPFERIVTLEQIHSANIALVSEAPEAHTVIEETDGIFTKLQKVALTVKTADCVPILYSDLKKEIIAITHQGWRGSLKRMPQKMIKKLVEEGAQVAHIRVAIGPSIGECCYTIDDDRHFEFLDEFDEDANKFFSHRGGKWHLNLTRLNYFLLASSGLKKENIDFFPFCTSCNRDRFFSFRRKQVKHKDFDRQFNVIVKT